MAGFINRASLINPTDKTVALRRITHGPEAFRVRDHTTVVIPDGFHITKLPAMKAAGLGHPKSSGGLGMAIGTRGFGAIYTGAKVRQNNASKR